MVGDLEWRKILFIDIETVSQLSGLQELPEKMQSHWKRRAQVLLRNQETPPDEEQLAQVYEDRAAIYSEFGKIICISVGILYKSEDGGFGMRTKSFAGDDERDLLIAFADLLQTRYPDPARSFLCGHNIREFDIPYICRRMVIHRIPLPGIINLSGKKPWETKHLLDTMELWKFGDIKHYTSLDLLTTILDIPSSKSDIDGSMVGRVYWQDGDLPRIAAYCEQDVVTVANLLLRYQYLNLVREELIVKAEP